MPNTYYGRQWLDAQKDLEKLMSDDKIVQEDDLIEDRQVAIDIVMKLYFRYRRIVQRLTTCHDQIVQPQIRELLGKQLDYSIVRMLELRQEIVNLTFIECPWPNDMLLDMKLTPEDVQLTAPAYDSASREAELERRRKVVEDANKPIEDDISSEVSSLQTYASDAEESKTTGFRSRRPRGKSQTTTILIDLTSKETPEQKIAKELREAIEKERKNAVTLIQSHERARVARKLAKNAILDRDFRVKLASDEFILKKVEPEEQERSAMVIQRCWRHFRARLHYEKRIAELEDLLGMTIPNWHSKDDFKLGEQAFQERLHMQIQAADKLQDTIKTHRQKLWEIRGPELIEDIREEIRQWFLLWFNELGYFDFIPPIEDGGSILITTGQVRTPAEYLAASPEEKKKKTSKDRLGEDDEEEEEPEEEPEGWKMSESKVYHHLVETKEEFNEHWSHRNEQILDPDAKPIIDLIIEPICYELQLEMRLIADQTMRQELQLLNEALIADSIENGAAFVPPKPQVFERQIPEPPLKERLDPLANIPPDELLIELSRQDVLRDCPKERLNDWPGCLSYEILTVTEPNLGDVLQVIMDYCVLPFGTKRVNLLAPEVRSVCLCGPPGCGQLFIARAICSELKATVFDLTPERHIGRFLQRSKQDQLIQAVLKLSKLYAPSVILVEDESAFFKQIPAEMRQIQPKRFAAIYRKIVKGIKPGDQVLFLTASQQPYMATSSFVKLYDKFIIIPVADRSTLCSLYKNGLMRLPNVSRHVDVSSLARITAAEKTMPLELANKAMELTTTIRRRIEFKRKSFKPEEILDGIFQLGVPKKDIDSWLKFKDKLPQEVQRMELELLLAEQQDDKKKKK